jgi:hypothetical protein
LPAKEARDLLQQTVGRFKGSYQTRSLIDAKALLEQLSRRVIVSVN